MRTVDEIGDDVEAAVVHSWQLDPTDTARLMDLVFRLDHLRAEMMLARQPRREDP